MRIAQISLSLSGTFWPHKLAFVPAAIICEFFHAEFYLTMKGNFKYVRGNFENGAKNSE